MPRIVGIDLPKEKRILIALTYIHGIGRMTSQKVLKIAGIDESVRAKDLTADEVSRITAILQKDCRIEGDVRRDVAQNIKRLMEIGCYRGIRHRKGLPVRGQKSKTNARTRKGPKKTVVGKKKVAAKK